jgi:hypothetical protein
MRLVFLLHPHQHGWRWAIYWAKPDNVTDRPLEQCVNAGFEATRDEADRRGQDCLYTVLAFMARTGRPVPKVEPITLDSDPLPPAAQLSAVQVADNVVQIGV